MSVTREKLYEEIWAEPNTKVSKRYGVSDSYLVRILKSLNIPRPPRGYWATVAADIHPEKPPLPIGVLLASKDEHARIDEALLLEVAQSPVIL